MTDIDERIRAALAEEDSELLKELEDEPGLIETVSSSFHGKMGWVMYSSYFLGFAAFGAGVYAFIRFLEEPDVKSSLAWLVGIFACMLTLAITKILAWQQLQRMVLMREIKRLELRVLSLMDKRG